MKYVFKHDIRPHETFKSPNLDKKSKYMTNRRLGLGLQIFYR